MCLLTVHQVDELHHQGTNPKRPTSNKKVIDVLCYLASNPDDVAKPP